MRFENVSYMHVLGAAFLVAMCLFAPVTLADMNTGWSARLEVGQTTLVKNLLSERRQDRKRIIKSYNHQIRGGLVDFTYIVTRADGSTESFELAELKNESFNRIFSGNRLDVRMTRRAGDAGDLISIVGSLHTRTEGEAGFP